jgi:hypothetical protein
VTIIGLASSIPTDGRGSELVADKLLALRHRVATSCAGSAIAELRAERWREIAGASLLLIDGIARPPVRRGANVSAAMMTAEPMITRGAHYTALLDTIDHPGAPNCTPRSESNCSRPRMPCCSASLTASRPSGRPRL